MGAETGQGVNPTTAERGQSPTELGWEVGKRGFHGLYPIGPVIEDESVRLGLFGAIGKKARLINRELARQQRAISLGAGNNRNHGVIDTSGGWSMGISSLNEDGGRELAPGKLRVELYHGVDQNGNLVKTDSLVFFPELAGSYVHRIAIKDALEHYVVADPDGNLSFGEKGSAAQQQKASDAAPQLVDA